MDSFFLFLSAWKRRKSTRILHPIPFRLHPKHISVEPAWIWLCNVQRWRLLNTNHHLVFQCSVFNFKWRRNQISVFTTTLNIKRYTSMISFTFQERQKCDRLPGGETEHVFLGQPARCHPPRRPGGEKKVRDQKDSQTWLRLLRGRYIRHAHSRKLLNAPTAGINKIFSFGISFSSSQIGNGPWRGGL